MLPRTDSPHQNCGPRQVRTGLVGHLCAIHPNAVGVWLAKRALDTTGTAQPGSHKWKKLVEAAGCAEVGKEWRPPAPFVGR